jgi:hypothetical protein
MYVCVCGCGRFSANSVSSNKPCVKELTQYLRRVYIEHGRGSCQPLTDLLFSQATTRHSQKKKSPGEQRVCLLGTWDRPDCLSCCVFCVLSFVAKDLERIGEAMECEPSRLVLGRRPFLGGINWLDLVLSLRFCFC